MSRRSAFLRKWAGFLSAIWLMIFSGTYTFFSFSSALKDVLGISQTLLNEISIARDVGDAFIGIVSGILSNHLPVWALLCISTALGFLGYGVEWLIVSETISPLPYWAVFVASMATGSAVCWMNVAVFTASVRNFSQNRGPVAGLFKAYMGLSAAVFVAFGNTLFSDSASAYLLMLAVVPSTFSLISAALFQPVPSSETQGELQVEKTSLLVFDAMACVLAVYIAVLNLLPTSTFEESYVYKVVAISILIAILGCPALVPLVFLSKVTEFEGTHDNQKESLRFDDEEKIESDKWITVDNAVSEKKALGQPLLENVMSDALITSASTEEMLQIRVAKPWSCSRLCDCSSWTVEELGEDYSTLHLLKTWHYYIFYFSLFCGCGSGLTFCNNLGQLGQALGFADSNLFASLFSVGSFFGRIAAGNISEYFLRVMGIPRPAWMAFTKPPMILFYMWLSTGSITSLYIGSPVIGFCHGCLVTLAVPIISEFYGLKHFGTNFMLSNTCFLTGSYSFSSLAGYLYDLRAIAQTGSAATCDGAECYAATFRIVACCLTFALAFDAILTLISRPLYRKLKGSLITCAPNSNNHPK